MCANPGSSGGGAVGGLTSGNDGNETGGDLNSSAGGDGNDGDKSDGGDGGGGPPNPTPMPQPTDGGILVLNIPVDPGVGASGSSPAGGIGQTAAGSSSGRG